MTDPGATTVDDLAWQLGVDAGDVEVVLDWLDVAPAGGRLTGAQCGEVRQLLEPHCERSVPEAYGLADPDWRGPGTGR